MSPMHKTPQTAEEALCLMVEYHLATLDWIRSIKRTPKSEIERQKSIATDGIAAVRRFVACDIPDTVGATRVVRVMNKEREL